MHDFYCLECGHAGTVDEFTETGDLECPVCRSGDIDVAPNERKREG